jgi:hypothetical protein
MSRRKVVKLGDERVGLRVPSNCNVAVGGIEPLSDRPWMLIVTLMIRVTFGFVSVNLWTIFGARPTVWTALN